MSGRFRERLLDCEQGEVDLGDYLSSLSHCVVTPMQHLYDELLEVTGYKHHWSDDYLFDKADALMCHFKNALIVLDRLNVEAQEDLRKQTAADKGNP